MSEPGASDLKTRVAAEIGSSLDELTALGEELHGLAELGFREVRTASRLQPELVELDLPVETDLARTGLRAQIVGSSPGPSVALLGELDGLPTTGTEDPAAAAHICGHHTQLVHMVAVARALVRSRAMGELHGSVQLIATPAEEYVDLDWRLEQVEQGRIEFLSGKQELIRLGTFESVDMALMAHATGRPENRRLSTHAGSNGVLAKRVRFLGRAAHAAEGPHLGINALNAATLAMSAIHFQHETFRDEDRVRVHGILTRGGEATNIVPADVRSELFVRAATQVALDFAAAKVDRCLVAAAQAVGAGLRVDTLPGYLPLRQSPLLMELFQENARSLVGESGFAELGPTAVSTDAGDLSHLIPVVHGFHGGFSGESHADDFRVADPVDAIVTPATALAWTIIDLLSDGAALAQRAIRDFQPALTTTDYLHRLRTVGGRLERPLGFGEQEGAP